jgi:two-component system sensor histidine kinase PilS (NtrC family)
MEDAGLFKRLKALIMLRVFFVTLLLGTYLIFGIGFYRFPYPDAILYIIIALYLLSIVYAVLLSRVKNLTSYGYVQLSLDAVASIALILVTGGIESWFSFVMLLIVIAAAITMNKKAGFITATLCSILYGLMLDLQYYRIIPIAYDLSVREKDFLYNIFSHITSLYLTAYLTGYMSSRLEKTSLRLAEKDSDLRDLTYFNQELIEGLPSGLLTTDLSGNILIFNRAAENIVGVPRSGAIGKNIVEIFPFIEPPLETQRSEGLITVSGNTRTIGLGISVSTDSSEQRTGYICIFQDITELKKLEAELKHKETLATIGEISANMAHEIRNPLASLKGSIEMLKEGTLTKDHGEKLMNIALSEMDRLNKIITDFLTYSRPKALEFFRFDLHTMLDEILELIKSATMKSGAITIKKEFSGENLIFADPQKLRQVFMNLGMNAIESMPAGGEVVISTRNLKDSVIISVKDSGTGITYENLKDIFFPFFTTKDRGTGLGLSIAYRIVEEHLGKITVRSAPGKGTTFTVVLPVAQDQPIISAQAAKGDLIKTGTS